MPQPKLRVRASGYGGSGYRIPTRESEERPKVVVPGVTTVLKVIDKPALVQWAADQTAAYAVVNVDNLLSRTQEQGFGFLRYFSKRTPKEGDPLRQAHQYVLNDAAELGTNTHDWIEAYLLGEELPDIESPEMEEMIEVFLEWFDEHEVSVNHSESTVYNPALGYAGTLDLDWQVDGFRHLTDIKTSRGLWREHRMQLASLMAAPIRMAETHSLDLSGVKYITEGAKEETYWKEETIDAWYDRVSFLHIRPRDTDSKGNFVPAFCELKEVEMSMMNKYYRSFENALNLVYSLDELKDYEKEW